MSKANEMNTLSVSKRNCIKTNEISMVRCPIS